MYGTTKILSLIVHLVGLIGPRPIESFGPLQFGHYPNPTTIKFLTNRLNALQATTDGQWCVLSPLCSMLPVTRRFPPPWTVEEHNAACFIVRDAMRGKD